MDKTVILMIEDTKKENCDNLNERLERLKFYEKNGFQKDSVDVMYKRI